jgi:UDP-GlcNAc:undecaprenyl-phosphate GlcNAc-1-phosphate transferase
MTHPLFTTLPILFGLSLVACLLLTPLARGLARRCGLVDRPDGRRKMHDRAIPVAGGLAILVSSVAVLAAAAVVPNPLQEALAAQGGTLFGLLLGAVTICAIGVADDARGLRGRHKLLGQLLAVGIVLGSGVLVDSLEVFGWRIELGVLALPFTAFWLLGAINSLNLLDGMDGLLGSIGLIVCLALALLAGAYGHGAAAGVAVVLAGSLLGFLRYNFPPASVFLGDSGSMLVGLTVGVLAIQSSLKGPATAALAAPVALLILPIFDTTAAIVRRKLTGRSLYTTDRGHLHHCLLRTGLSSRGVLLLVAVLSLVTVGGVLASIAWKSEPLALLSALVVVAILVLTRLFGHAELLLVHKRCTALAVSLLKPPAGQRVQQLEVRLQGTGDWKELWARLTAHALELNLKSVRLDVNAPAIQEGYHARWDRHHDEGESSEVWRAEMPLSAAGQSVGRLEITGLRSDGFAWNTMAAVARLVEEIESAVSDLAHAHGERPRLPVAVALREVPV